VYAKRFDSRCIGPISIRDVEQSNTLLSVGCQKSHPYTQVSLSMIVLRTWHCPNLLHLPPIGTYASTRQDSCRKIELM
jgi:hypothetical protein